MARHRPRRSKGSRPRARIRELREITIDDRTWLYIFTSGSTGLPKAVNVSHARVMQWGLWFAGMMNAQPSDRLYNCLPMYHEIGGVLAPGAMLAAARLASRAREVLGEPFLERHQALGVYRVAIHRRTLPLPAAPPLCGERDHNTGLRLACGNGLAPQRLGRAFQQQPHIRRSSSFAHTLPRRRHLAVQRAGQARRHRPHSLLSEAPLPALRAGRLRLRQRRTTRNENGFCIRCGVNEPGEAIGKVQSDPASARQPVRGAAPVRPGSCGGGEPCA